MLSSRWLPAFFSNNDNDCTPDVGSIHEIDFDSSTRREKTEPLIESGLLLQTTSELMDTVGMRIDCGLLSNRVKRSRSGDRRRRCAKFSVSRWDIRSRSCSPDQSHSSVRLIESCQVIEGASPWCPVPPRPWEGPRGVDLFSNY